MNHIHMSTQKPDDFDAVRIVVDQMKDFSPEEQQRIFRWAAEKLNLPHPFQSSLHESAPQTLVTRQPTGSQTGPPAAGGVTDIKTFMLDKKPRNDVQFSAAVAYYYRFEAPQAQRKEAINKEDLQEATRKVGRDRFADPSKTLSNAHMLGLLDKGPEKGTYTINSVGENLVAMTLPDRAAGAKPGKKKAAKKIGKKTLGRVAKKKAARKTK